MTRNFNKKIELIDGNKIGTINKIKLLNELGFHVDCNEVYDSYNKRCYDKYTNQFIKFDNIMIMPDNKGGVVLLNSDAYSMLCYIQEYGMIDFVLPKKVSVDIEETPMHQFPSAPQPLIAYKPKPPLQDIAKPMSTAIKQRKGLLYIVPKRPASEPVIDSYTRKITAAFRMSRDTGLHWRGWHTCVCGANSTSTDYIIGDYVTNSLCIHYVACHRSEVPTEQLRIIASLPYGEENPTKDELHVKDDSDKPYREPLVWR